ncbi:FAD/NAD-P-binding domain-containing protein [Chiua virens]|nr:FAD/NAD-P-binding domain-containing protein [Chiua virens]
MPDGKTADSVRQESVGIIGAGPAGLITAYTFLQDGFQSVQILTRDKSVGGVVHGEFVFSSLPMPSPAMHERLGNRLCGADMIAYFEKFADTYLAGKIRFETEVLDIRRGKNGMGWDVEVRDLKTGNKKVSSYARIVLCTGGCSQPLIPEPLSAKSAQQAGFHGTVLHTSEFASNLDQILSEAQVNPDYSVVVVGGGKSAQDISSLLARHGIGVSVEEQVLVVYSSIIYTLLIARLLKISSNIITTYRATIGPRALFTHYDARLHDYNRFMELVSFEFAHSLFWGIRNNDEGSGKKDGFHALANEGKIKLVAPNRAKGYSADGESLLLQDGQTLRADLIILATGYTSSWKNIFTEKTVEELGIGIHPSSTVEADEWAHYKTLASTPPAHPQKDQWASSIYRGLVPAKNITKRDFAISGAVFTANSGYAFEVIAHWMSSYFLGDKMRLPSTVEEALAETERYSGLDEEAVPQRIRVPQRECHQRGRIMDVRIYVLMFSVCTMTDLALRWPQAMDELLEDMGLRTMRSGGNWLTWPFKVITVEEIAMLSEERRIKREADAEE